MDKDWATIQKELAKPFPESAISWKIQSYTKRKQGDEYTPDTQAIKVAFIDARDVENRLDEVVGTGNWSDSYVVHPSGVIQCALTIGGVTKEGFGYPNSDRDDEPLKSAESDALKRAAVKFGVGRHLYEVKRQYVSVDKYGHEIRGNAPSTNTQASGTQQQNTRSNGNGQNSIQTTEKSASQQEDSKYPRGDISESQQKLIRDTIDREPEKKDALTAIVREFLDREVGKEAKLIHLSKRQGTILIDSLRRGQ